MARLGDEFQELAALRESLRRKQTDTSAPVSPTKEGKVEAKVIVKKKHQFPGKTVIPDEWLTRRKRQASKQNAGRGDIEVRSQRTNPLGTPSAPDRANPPRLGETSLPDFIPSVAPCRPVDVGMEWADPSRLRIEGGRAFSRDMSDPGADRSNDGTLAIIGLDFGTAFTKAVVRFRDRDYAVDWSRAVNVETGDKFLCPSILSEDEAGNVVIGRKAAAGWHTHDGLKMSLIQSAHSGTSDNQKVEASVLFLAAVVRYIQWWARTNVAGAKSEDIRWRLHLGLPSSVADDAAGALFKRLGGLAYRLATSSGALRRSAISRLDTSPEDRVAVIPELQAQLSTYNRSKQRQGDLHVLFDVGAGTIDCAFFLDHNTIRGDVLTVAGCQVEPLGVHYLIAALAGKRGADLQWKDDDSGQDDKEVSRKTGDTEALVSARRRNYVGKLKAAFEKPYLEMRKNYQTGPVNHRIQPLRIFLCGGGSRNGTIRAAVERELREQFIKLNRVCDFAVTNLPTPVGGSFVYDGNAYDRMAVAHGLCETKLNLGRFYTGLEGRPVIGQIADFRDRDELYGK